MTERLQCQTHTRTPWGQNPHRYDYRLRYLFMGLLCTSVLAVFIVSLVVIGNRAMKTYRFGLPDESPTTSAESPPRTWSVPYTNSTATASTTRHYRSGRVT
ncbi:hypothetical protein Trco_004392 [Trichoderma cornu-damae]|uniref:Uncharacterized protein n=1 Tax=Trichoderma cornu-damae TaxID=654480 RepID=A0A9P8TY73_9HYPO|nr:hypothetical protein Trco_004392 [Trichoderma cornu-damae]